MDIAELYVKMLSLSVRPAQLSEQNYHDIITCLRLVQTTHTVDDLKVYYKKYNFSENCDPFPVIEKLRYAYVFGSNNHRTDIEDICKLITCHFE